MAGIIAVFKPDQVEMFFVIASAGRADYREFVKAVLVPAGLNIFKINRVLKYPVGAFCFADAEANIFFRKGVIVFQFEGGHAICNAVSPGYEQVVAIIPFEVDYAGGKN